ncbi:TonB-dependent receptor plug domain-containing protein [Neokomagataea thailandica]|nr:MULTISPECIES: TonB-dependent receptor [Neokomagataea]
MKLRQNLLRATILASTAWSLQASSALAATTHSHKAHTHTQSPVLSTMPAPSPSHAGPIIHPHHSAPHSEDESVVVTGTHATNRHARQSIAPISVISNATLRRSGAVNLADAITHTYAQINVSNMGGDSGALTSSIRMRGLNPNQVLVLVDGKRRHTTANIYQDSGPEFGATPVDLSMIPANMVDHIEVLEDGAAAMYGSDAIAGVVNIITKKQSHGFNISAQSGANAYNGDGWQYQVNGDGGFKWGDTGYVHIGAQLTHSDHFITKNVFDHRLIGYTPPGVASVLYTAPAGGYQPPATSNKIMSTPEETRENLFINFGRSINDNIDFYGQVSYAHRHSEAFENYRTPNKAPEVHPFGFSPIETNEENDFGTILGLKGQVYGFDWDLSTVYGEDIDRIGNKNTANHALYVATGYTPTDALAEGYSMSQWTNTLDFRRHFSLFNAVPVTWAFGAQHRLDGYQITAGNPASYLMGGTAGYAGLTPQDAGKWWRNIWAGYTDADFHFTPKWEVDFAGRYEHYTDVGNNAIGKVSTRYDFTKRIGIRGTISNGFRAPTLAEQNFSALNVAPNGAGGLLPVNSAAARSLGASPLKPERSVSASGGIVVEPVTGWHIETDVYQINIRDRVVQGGTTNGPTAVAAIKQMGLALPSDLSPADYSNVTASYFANGASTRTQGLDIKTDYLFHLHKYGNLAVTAALDLNRTRLHHNGIGSNGEQLLTQQNIAAITTEYPRSKLILNAYWTYQNWDVNLRQTRYGETTGMMTYEDWTPSAAVCPKANNQALQYSNSCFAQFKNTPRWLTDLEVGYRFNDHWHVAVGGNNLFNIRPRKLPANLNSLGASVYDQDSAQVPMFGGYYYGRINATF